MHYYFNVLKCIQYYNISEMTIMIFANNDIFQQNPDIYN